MGGGVDSTRCEKICRSDLDDSGGNLDYYLDELKYDMVHKLSFLRESSLLMTSFRRGVGLYSYNGYVYSLESGEMYDSGFGRDNNFKRQFKELNLFPFFDMVEDLESRIGSPQYFEWAMTFDESGPQYWITQISDVKSSLDVAEFGDLGDIVFRGHHVLGSGVICCDGFVDVSRSSGEALNKYNASHSNYGLIYPGSMITCGRSALPFSRVSNASLIVEEPNVVRCDTPISHWSGLLNETGKFFGVVDMLSKVEPNFEAFEFRNVDGLYVSDKRFNVYASERRNELFVTL